ncbi:hypothetical protein CXG81DRAFT_18184 [Caulochytrium protostelioides]|uniref:Uncharacterized protein n=1 Tax=Caulochytrium protostelioides TaxID=1555241 RepID=A0A4P9X9W2_9FUNG|nr:hypothetical protein CXG81DRAFT_18184 [Caulochytrium protostelioides]|eukprot:RKP02144.1 hypothetical protein CXG81DRAFT_18184 [Caulochytrium protostelioides]
MPLIPRAVAPSHGVATLAQVLAQVQCSPSTGAIMQCRTEPLSSLVVTQELAQCRQSRFDTFAVSLVGEASVSMCCGNRSVGWTPLTDKDMCQTRTIGADTLMIGQGTEPMADDALELDQPIYEALYPALPLTEAELAEGGTQNAAAQNRSHGAGHTGQGSSRAVGVALGVTFGILGIMGILIWVVVRGRRRKKALAAHPGSASRGPGSRGSARSSARSDSSARPFNSLEAPSGGATTPGAARADGGAAARKTRGFFGLLTGRSSILSISSGSGGESGHGDAFWMRAVTATQSQLVDEPVEPSTPTVTAGNHSGAPALGGHSDGEGVVIDPQASYRGVASVSGGLPAHTAPTTDAPRVTTRRNRFPNIMNPKAFNFGMKTKTAQVAPQTSPSPSPSLTPLPAQAQSQAQTEAQPTPARAEYDMGAPNLPIPASPAGSAVSSHRGSRHIDISVLPSHALTLVAARNAAGASMAAPSVPEAASSGASAASASLPSTAPAPVSLAAPPGPVPAGPPPSLPRGVPTPPRSKTRSAEPSALSHEIKASPEPGALELSNLRAA